MAVAPLRLRLVGFGAVPDDLQAALLELGRGGVVEDDLVAALAVDLVRTPDVDDAGASAGRRLLGEALGRDHR